jgi:hypothetical protein
VLSLADRIAVMYRGQIAGVLAASEATPEMLGYLMATGGSAAVAPTSAAAGSGSSPSAQGV